MVFAAVLSIFLVAAAGVIFITDPYFQYHMPWFGMKTYVSNQRYSNPGLAKNADYDAIIAGSSMSENFNCEWFDEAYGINTIQLTYSGSSVQDWVNAVTMAEENKNVKYVFGNIDFWMLEQEYGKVRYELPEYLYDKNYFNDINYLLNKDILFDVALRRFQSSNYIENLKSAYVWYEYEQFGFQNAIEKTEYNGEIKNIKQYKVPIDENIKKVVKQMKETILKYSDTTFLLFYSPANIIWYYGYALNGNIDKILDVYLYSMNELLECENVKLFFPSYNNMEMISELDSYTDLRHYNMDISYIIFQQMVGEDNMVKKDNYEDIIKWFRNEIMNYNYKKLYEKYVGEK